MLGKKLRLYSLILFNIIFIGHFVYASDINNLSFFTSILLTTDKKLDQDPELLKFRNKIDSLDANLLTILAERIEVVKKVGEYKKLHNLPVYQPDRYKELIKRRQKLGLSIGLDENFILKLFDLIHDNSVNIQKNLK